MHPCLGLSVAGEKENKYGESFSRFLEPCTWDQLMTIWERFPAKWFEMLSGLPDDKWLAPRSDIGIKNKGHSGMKKDVFSLLSGDFLSF